MQACMFGTLKMGRIESESINPFLFSSENSEFAMREIPQGLFLQIQFQCYENLWVCQVLYQM